MQMLLIIKRDYSDNYKNKQRLKKSEKEFITVLLFEGEVAELRAMEGERGWELKCGFFLSGSFGSSFSIYNI